MGNTPVHATSLVPLALILSVCLLSLKMLFLGMRTAMARGTAKRFVNREDTVWLGGETVPIDIDIAARWRRAHLNDLENFVPYMALGTGYASLGGNHTVGLGYIGAFTLARFLHSAAYLGEMARLRRDSYTAGFLVLAAMAIHVGVLAVSRL